MNSFERKALRQASDVHRAAREAKRVRLLAVAKADPGITGRALAERFGVSPNQVKNWLMALHSPNPLLSPRGTH
ncbi:MAG: helix-turn-helix domain-containing protein [Elusimicrobiota bacterium]|jgi:hypothetical protein